MDQSLGIRPTRHFGAASLVAAGTSWAALAFTLVVGGLDPGPAQARLLRVVAAGALVCALAAFVLAAVALVRGPQRGLATAGLLLSLFFLLMFTGVTFRFVG